MKNVINNNCGCTTPWAAFHPVLQSCSVWQPRSYPGPAGSMIQAGITESLRKSRSLSSSSKTLIFPVCCFLSVCGSGMQLSCNSCSNPSLLSRLFCKPGLERKMRWCDTQNLLVYVGQAAKSPWQVQVNSSKDPGGSVSWGAAALHLLLLFSFIWDVLKHLLVIIPSYLINFK